MTDNDIDKIKTEKKYSVSEVCKILGVTRDTVFKLFNMGELSHFSISEKNTVVLESELKKFLDKKKDLHFKRRKL